MGMPTEHRRDDLWRESNDIAADSWDHIEVAQQLKTKATKDGQLLLEVGVGLVLAIEALRLEIRAASVR